ncbi:peptide-methionine (S)-S-oxide reductase MsrA [Wenzhouxiangella sediminis]|uniref:Peptide methionine sulfoxide reductase MsrA n=1 Tax=Wenzhouxiangella sediminis TaxID=1792836 RepID=A0A3E1KCB2_9GAMM|nr:peptide-methionine (S)-S-oxide reductase MsrA [Wenzhouxiangella sediminis]RFF32416.1 peptide-methionine (S)-S-oxide reductase [Wenzhouxiangella sediminis]
MSSKATFGAGCFWGVEMRFREMPGVIDATVGYMGGHVDNPTYKQVCGDTTGHAEVCEVVFDPERIDYQDLVRAFFDLHDPTQVNRQGPDVGTQYRSVIFVHDDQQHRIAEQVRSEVDASGRFRAPVATSIEPAATFWPAEDYHQQYLAKNGGSCAVSGH